MAPRDLRAEFARRLGFDPAVVVARGEARGLCSRPAAQVQPRIAGIDQTTHVIGVPSAARYLSLTETGVIKRMATGVLPHRIVEAWEVFAVADLNRLLRSMEKHRKRWEPRGAGMRAVEAAVLRLSGRQWTKRDITEICPETDWHTLNVYLAALRRRGVVAVVTRAMGPKPAVWRTVAEPSDPRPSASMCS